MEEKKKASLASIKAAERVGKLFSQGNQNLPYSLIKQPQTHNYDPVIIPKIPKEMRRLPFHGKNLKNAPKKQRNWNSKQKEGTRTLALNERSSKQKALSPNRVKLCKLREHYIASRKLKSISVEKQVIDHLKNNFTVLYEKQAENFIKDERMEYWEEFIKNREERHFNIGRIIKYLSD